MTLAAAPQPAAPQPDPTPPQSESLIDEALRSLGYEGYWDRVSPMITEYGIRALGALIFLLVALWFSGVVSRAVRRGLERVHVETTLVRFLSNLSRALVMILAVLTCMSIVGINITSFAALLGAGGLAVGFALQGSLSNIAAGAAISITRPFKVGDVVVVAGQTGVIQEVGLFSTHLNTFDNRRIIIPNGQIFGAVIENITYNNIRRVEVPVGVEYSADIDRTRAVLEEAARAVPGAEADPPPRVLLTGFGDSSVNWMVQVWVPKEDFVISRHETHCAVKKALDKAGIGIPFPQRVLHFTPTPLQIADKR